MLIGLDWVTEPPPKYPWIYTETFVIVNAFKVILNSFPMIYVG